MVVRFVEKMLSEREGEGEQDGVLVAVSQHAAKSIEKSTSEPERDALLRCRRRVSVLGDESAVPSLESRPRPEERIEMLDDLVRLGRWKTGLVEDDGRGGGAERGVSIRRLLPG